MDFGYNNGHEFNGFHSFFQRTFLLEVTPNSWTIQLLGVFLVALVPAILKSERVEVKFTD